MARWAPDEPMKPQITSVATGRPPDDFPIIFRSFS